MHSLHSLRSLHVWGCPGLGSGQASALILESIESPQSHLTPHPGHSPWNKTIKTQKTILQIKKVLYYKTEKTSPETNITLYKLTLTIHWPAKLNITISKQTVLFLHKLVQKIHEMGPFERKLRFLKMRGLRVKAMFPPAPMGVVGPLFVWTYLFTPILPASVLYLSYCLGLLEPLESPLAWWVSG